MQAPDFGCRFFLRNGDGTAFAVVPITDHVVHLRQGIVPVIHEGARLNLVFAGGQAADNKVGLILFKGGGGPAIGSLQTVPGFIAVSASFRQAYRMPPLMAIRSMLLDLLLKKACFRKDSGHTGTGRGPSRGALQLF